MGSAHCSGQFGREDEVSVERGEPPQQFALLLGGTIAVRLEVVEMTHVLDEGLAEEKRREGPDGLVERPDGLGDHAVIEIGDGEVVERRDIQLVLSEHVLEPMLGMAKETRRRGQQSTFLRKAGQKNNNNRKQTIITKTNKITKITK